MFFMKEKEHVKKDWSQSDTWAEELVEQSKSDKEKWRRAFWIVLALFWLTNAYWIYVMNSYEYVYQDGSGQNNYNKNIDGDVHNVTTGEVQEEQ